MWWTDSRRLHQLFLNQYGPSGPPFPPPNCNVHVERFLRSMKEECLNRVMFFGEGHLRRSIAEFVTGRKLKQPCAPQSGCYTKV